MTSPSSNSTELVNDNQLNVIHFSNEFPNDDLRDLLRKLHNHSKSRQHRMLASFLEEATMVLRDELARLPKSIASQAPIFETIIEWANHTELRKGALGGATEGLLLCVVEIASLIGHYESNGSTDGFSLPIENGCFVGMGIGLLASASVSISSSLSDLVYYGAEAIRTGFRLGVHVDKISQGLEPREPEVAPGSWAYVVTGLSEADVQKELDTMNVEMGYPEPCKIFISAAGETSVTISGPPSRLAKLTKTSEVLRYAKWVPLPVYSGLCHAPHVYTMDDAKAIADPTALSRLQSASSPKVPFLSTQNGKRFNAKDAQDLFEQVVFELLTGTIRWDSVVAEVSQYASAPAVSQLNLQVFRSSPVANDILSRASNAVEGLKTSSSDLISWIFDGGGTSDHEVPRGPAGAKLAIVGMSCRMPGGGNNNEAFWDLLEQGLDVHQKIPADRFDVESHYDPAGKRLNASKTPYGCFIQKPGMFDAGFFNMSPREAEQTDPMQRLALVTAHEALEMAGFVPNRTPSTNLQRIGVFYGQASDDYREVNTAQSISTYFIPGGCRAFGPGRINYFYKFGGPSFSIDTACSSSLATIQTACTSLWAGDSDMIVAGGMNVLTNSDAFAGLSNGHFLSPTGNCKTWDAGADGYCRGDGVGSIIIKRLDDAIADNDNVLATINSAATDQSAEAVSITHPHAGAQEYLYKQVMNRAGVSPLDVSYMEYHGTGTQAGDSTEMESVTNVFAPLKERRRADQPLHVGAVKSNVGHGEAAAGITAMCKLLSMFKHGKIPKHPGVKTDLNPAFKKDIEGGKRNVKIPWDTIPWERNEERIRYAVLNNFSAAGGNTTMLLEEGPTPREITQTDPRETHAITISAKSKVSLKANLESLLGYLERTPDVKLADLAYTLCARRMHYNHRITVTATSIESLKKELTSHVDTADKVRPLLTSVPPVAFSFTGQGAMYSPMAKELYADSPAFRTQIDAMGKLCEQHGFPSFVPALDGSADEEYLQPIVTQLTIVCVEMALADYWRSLDITPNVVIGASLGEYAALNVAGVLSTSDVIFLTGKRAQELAKQCTIGSHVMLAVRASVEDIKTTAGDKPYEVACINAPKDVVIDGRRENIDEARRNLEAKGFKCHQLEVPYAFHSEQMEPALDGFEKTAYNVTFKAPQIPVISPLLSNVVFDAKTINAEYMRRATRNPVDFVGALAAAQDFGVIDTDTVWIDVGPHPVCASFIKNCIPEVKATVPTLRRNEANWTTLAQSMSQLHNLGIHVDWNEFHRPFVASHKLLDLPSYSWNERNLWIQYNGTWALTKGNDSGVPMPSIGNITNVEQTLKTSTVHSIIEEQIEGLRGNVTVQSDVMHPDFLEAANGHRMNDCGVVTSSVHGDIAFTIAEYLYKRIVKGCDKAPGMNIKNLRVLQGLIANKITTSPQLIQIKAETDLDSEDEIHLKWYNVPNDSEPIGDHFASCTVEFGSSTDWLFEWSRTQYLVKSRVGELERMARDGSANRLSRNMVYSLFGKLVDYAEKYRGMQSVILNGHEAVADIALTKEKGGVWTVPPYFIDSVAHLAGFIMNGSDASNTKDYFYVTPGWDSMRFAKPLVGGGRYRSYVKMDPGNEPGFYNGDVYIMQDDEVIGLVGSIIFRRFPRQLLTQFFSPPDVRAKNAAAKGGESSPKPAAPASQQAPAPAPKKTKKKVQERQPITSEKDEPAKVEEVAEEAPTEKAPAAPAANEAAEEVNPTIAKALELIAKETSLEPSQLTDDAAFMSMGVDSLMSLVLAEKFKNELQVEVKSSLFIECPNIGELKQWMEQYC